MEIPDILKNQDFRFIPLRFKDKIPIQEKWQSENNYKFDDPRLQEWIARGNNYGILGGYGNLLIVDFDQLWIYEKVVDKLPKTFKVKSGGGLPHLYFICDSPESYRIDDANGNRLIDILGRGKFAVAPGSIHPSGNVYQVDYDTGISWLDIAELKGVLSTILPKEQLPFMKNETKRVMSSSDDNVVDIKTKLLVSELLVEYGTDISRNPTMCPLGHDSRSRKCLSFDDKKGLWNCFHCGKGGSVIDLYMEKNNCDFNIAKKELCEKVGIRYKKTSLSIIKEITEEYYFDIMTKLYEVIPFFYDETKTFWVWNNELKYYERTDDVTLLKELWLRSKINTVDNKVKQNLVNALKQFGRTKHPKKFDKNWVQFKDVIVDISTKERFEAKPEYFCTNPIVTELGHSTETPTIDLLFEQWVGKAYVKTLHQIIAYCIYQDYPLHMIFVLIGTGLNGKSKFLDVLVRFLGINNVANSDLEYLNPDKNQFETSALYKKLAVLLGETNFSTLKKTSIIKRLTGQDLIAYRFKYATFPINDYNYAKIIVATNSLPITLDKTLGFYRRWLIIDFPNQFPKEVDILATIPEIEYKNMALKAVGLLQELLQTRQFDNQGSIEQRKERYEDYSNPLQKFMKEKTETKLDGHIFCFEFIQKFNIWQRDNGYRIWNTREIGIRMSEYTEIGRRNYETIDSSGFSITKQYKAYLGIDWKRKEDGDQSLKTTKVPIVPIVPMFPTTSYIYKVNGNIGTIGTIGTTKVTEETIGDTDNKEIIDITKPELNKMFNTQTESLIHKEEIEVSQTFKEIDKQGFCDFCLLPDKWLVRYYPHLVKEMCDKCVKTL